MENKLLLVETKEQLRKFLKVNFGAFLPPKPDFTAEFSLQLLKGEKKFLKKQEIKKIPIIPAIHIQIKNLYQKVKIDEAINKFLPDYPKSRSPNQMFLMTVINTVYPGKLKKIVQEVQKVKKQIKEAKKMLQITVNNIEFHDEGKNKED